VLIALTLALAGATPAQDWPQFNGPNRDNRSSETGLLRQWPEGGPPLLWRASGLGHGFSTVAIVEGLLYTHGDINGEMLVTALDLSGNLVWQRPNGRAYARQYPGSRSTPTVADGKLYSLSGIGNLACLDARTGDVLWSTDCWTKFGGREITWGISESPLVDGQNVICCPGGEDVFMVALDKDTGETRWTCTGVKDQHTYASPIVVDYGGLRQIVTLTAESAVGVEAATGRLLWKHPRPAPYGMNCHMAFYDSGHVYLFTTWGRGAAKLKLNVEGESCSVEEVWHTDQLDNEHGGVMLVDGYLYGHADNNHQRRHFSCLNAQTGALAWTTEELGGQGSSALTFAEGLLYVVTDLGEVALVKPNPERLEVLSRFSLPMEGAGPMWAYPVVCGGRLYLRHGEFLYAYDVRPPG
jgi:outer membrane protein assembly factor BamB